MLDVIFDNNYDECSFEDEHILLSCTLNKFMSKTSVDSTAKMKLTESLNSEKVRVLMANSNYQNATKKHVDISASMPKDIL